MIGVRECVGLAGPRILLRRARPRANQLGRERELLLEGLVRRLELGIAPPRRDHAIGGDMLTALTTSLARLSARSISRQDVLRVVLANTGTTILRPDAVTYAARAIPSLPVNRICQRRLTKKDRQQTSVERPHGGANVPLMAESASWMRRVMTKEAGGRGRRRLRGRNARCRDAAYRNDSTTFGFASRPTGRRIEAVS